MTTSCVFKYWECCPRGTVTLQLSQLKWPRRVRSKIGNIAQVWETILKISHLSSKIFFSSQWYFIFERYLVLNVLERVATRPRLLSFFSLLCYNRAMYYHGQFFLPEHPEQGRCYASSRPPQAVYLLISILLLVIMVLLIRSIDFLKYFFIIFVTQALKC